MPNRTAHAIADADDPDQTEDGTPCPRCGEQWDGCECESTDDLDALADRLDAAEDTPDLATFDLYDVAPF